MKIIALDIGSSFLKSAVLDTEANTLGHKTRTPTPARLANEDAACFELDADLLYQGVIGLVDDQIEKEPEVKGILFSTQMHGFVLTRGETAITPYVSWPGSHQLYGHKIQGWDRGLQPVFVSQRPYARSFRRHVSYPW